MKEHLIEVPLLDTQDELGAEYKIWNSLWIILTDILQESKDSNFNLQETVESLSNKQLDELWTSLNQMCTITLLSFSAGDDEEGQEVTYIPNVSRNNVMDCDVVLDRYLNIRLKQNGWGKHKVKDWISIK